MSEPTLYHRERDDLRAYRAACGQRARDEASFAATFTARREAFEIATAERKAAVDAALRSALATADAEHDAACNAVGERHAQDSVAAKTQGEAAKKRAIAAFKAKKAKLDEDVTSTKWEATTVYDAAIHGAKVAKKEGDHRLADETQTWTALRESAEDFLIYSRLAKAVRLELVPGSPETDDPLAALHEANVAANERLEAIERLIWPKLLRGANLLPIYVLIVSLCVAGGAFGLGLRNGGIAGGVGAFVLCLGITLAVRAAARKSAAARYPVLGVELGLAETLIERSKAFIASADEARRKEAAERRDSHVREVEKRATRIRLEAEAARDAAVKSAEEELAKQLAAIEARKVAETRAADDTHAAARAAAEARHRDDITTWETEDRAWRAAHQAESDREWYALRDRWSSATKRLRDEIAAIAEFDRRVFHDWTNPGPGWTPPAVAPPGMRFGAFDVEPIALPDGRPIDDGLRALVPQRFTWLASLPFPDNGSLMIRANREGRGGAVEAVQAVMLRFLTSVPPAKVRFTIIDPVGLGQNFAAFMHLADYEEALVTSRIWTEPSHIEQRLADLTEHMEKVIQKFLRNEFRTIQEYNEHAGEVAEPFRVLVVANFPAGFTEQAAKRLAGIAASGPRCGVYLLMTVDEGMPLPSGCSLADFEGHTTRLIRRDGTFLWRDGDFGEYPLRVDTPPPAETTTALMHEVGARAREAGKVEVPFEIVAPGEADFWKSDSRGGVDVPLGRVGANKLQHMRLGKGTSQHVLVAGRTGSGKSSLLHAMVTNAALRYSPDELELYLIDFKKGVEFKTYAAHALPHARVVAIESEREFGLSVLQRLDEELRRRGDKFRALNVQDVAGYRDSNGDEPMPRILLVVDEFQEFFVEDDKLAQECALLLDRLVRQGRAFGIHVLLGSQTLGGAFSLARSTLGQMGVRVALQCSESDAHLILSEDNGAARLLSRPGEAIYNDSNGAVEGNHFFQVVWLPDEKRECYLNRIAAMARSRDGRARRQIVFEGNIPADIVGNNSLRAVIEAPEAPGTKAPIAWLGDAVAIKDPTSVTFRRHSGANLLLVGQNEDAARGIVVSGLVSLAAQHAADGASFFLLDGTLEDSPPAGYFGRMANLLPQPLRIGEWRDAAALIGDVHAMLERRQADAATTEPPIWLVVYDLARFRDLRKSDDDYGFSRREEKPNPAKLLQTLLRDGPGFGIHTVVWCDSLNNLNRAFDRTTLKEFELRVLFQMSPNDSSTLIDSPSAGRLGQHRAYLASEEQGKLEKFRPYGLPDDAWWAWARERLASRPGAGAAIAT